MSISLMSAAWAVDASSHTNKLVLLALADNANDSGVCWPSIPNIAGRCSLDERSIYRAIATLEGLGHVTTESRPGKSTIYRVHPRQDVTPDRRSPLTNGRKTPDTPSPTPDSLSGTPDTVSGESSRILKNPQKNRQRLARSRTVPEDFQITESMRAWAQAKYPHVDITAETEKFRDHEYRDPHSNWNAAWRQWVRRSTEFRANGSWTVAVPVRTWRPTEEEGGSC